MGDRQGAVSRPGARKRPGHPEGYPGPTGRDYTGSCIRTSENSSSPTLGA
jgi:hypothetical protein